jgi:hypothetical protein
MPTLFHYETGRLLARFAHDTRFDYVNLALHLEDDITWVTECGPGGKPLAPPVPHQEPALDLTVYMSSAFCPFEDLVRFLEAIVLGVQECAFHWDAEGPGGDMRWRRSAPGTGHLLLRWSGARPAVSRRTLLETRDAAGALYGAFRAFVESPAYDPLRYEAMTWGRVLAAVCRPESLDDIARALARLPGDRAAVAVARMDEVAESRRDSGPALAFPLAHYLQAADSDLARAPLHDEWDGWSVEQRLDHLAEFFEGRTSGWFGADLRSLRSAMIEDWLAAQATAGP